MRTRPEYLPTPTEIAEACATIQTTWSPYERERRILDPKLRNTPPEWHPPQIHLAHCTARVRRAVGDHAA